MDHRASLHVAKSQSELVEVLARPSNPPDLVIAKDVAPDWFTVAAALLACRAFGRQTPFIVVAEPSDAWTRVAVDTAGGAALIDDRSSRWLVPLLVKDWLERYGHPNAARPSGEAQMQASSAVVKHGPTSAPA